MSKRTYVNNATNRSLGRVGMPHGSCVQSSRSSNSSVASSFSGRTYVDNSMNRSLGRVGMTHGSCVQSSKSSSSGATGVRTYVDNTQNRQLGRVGKEVGSHVVSKDGSVSISTTNPSSASKDKSGSSTNPFTASASGTTSCYVDNKLNRKLGRVGKPKGTHVLHKDGSISVCDRVEQREIERYIGPSTLEELEAYLSDLHFTDPIFSVVTNVRHKLHRQQVEESWEKEGIVPSTGYVESKEIIPLSEIHLEKEIGEGGFGRVYAGLWKRNPIAFKKFIYQQVTKKKQDLLVKEIKIFSALDHPNIVKMFGVVLDKNSLGIVMEYLPITLFSAVFIEDFKFQVGDKKRIMTEIVSAVEYLHTESADMRKPKIAHCDIKSQNVLLDAENVAKLCDFGLSVVKTSQASSSSCVSAAPGQGTPRYSAPEVLRGELLSLSELMKSDIYSLALVIYEFLVEEEPFENFNLVQLVENVGRKNVRPSLEESSLTEAMKQLLRKGWNKDAFQRPNIFEFSKELAKIVSITE